MKALTGDQRHLVEFEITHEEEVELRSHLAKLRNDRPRAPTPTLKRRLRPRTKTINTDVQKQLQENEPHSSDSDDTRREKNDNRLIAEYDEENESSFSDDNVKKRQKKASHHGQKVDHSAESETENETESETESETKSEEDDDDGEEEVDNKRGKKKRGNGGKKTKAVGAVSAHHKKAWKRPLYYDDMKIPQDWAPAKQQEKMKDYRKEVARESQLDLKETMTTLKTKPIRYRTSGRSSDKWEHAVDLVYLRMRNYNWTRDTCASVLRTIIMNKTQNETHQKKSTVPAKKGRRPWARNKVSNEDDDEDVEEVDDIDFSHTIPTSTSANKS